MAGMTEKELATDEHRFHREEKTNRQKVRKDGSGAGVYPPLDAGRG